MGVKWTLAQENAINSINGSVLISAAAGSGKTAVLVERVIKRITNENNPTDIDRMLIVTFTKAAASEMKERIQTSLDKMLKDDPLNSNLRRQKLLLNRANISTINSFCQNIVRENFCNVDISPDYKIADSSELILLKKEAYEKVIDDFYESDGETIHKILQSFDNNSRQSSFSSFIFKLHEFLTSHPFKDDFISDLDNMYQTINSVNIKDTLWAKTILNQANKAVNFAISLVEEELRLLTEAEYLQAKVTPILENDLKFITTLNDTLNNSNWDDIRELLRTHSFPPFKVNGYTKDEMKLKIGSHRTLFTSIVKDLKEKLFVMNENELKYSVTISYSLISNLFKVLNAFEIQYADMKKQRNIAEFNDLEHLALELLVKKDADTYKSTPFAHEMSKRYTEVMVDEYQDTNEIQDLIFSAVSGNSKNLFVVGDVKQSIYKFRQAMPQIFLNRKESYDLYNSDVDNYPSKIILDKNFRSRSGIIDAVNFIFTDIMSKQSGEIDYNDEEKLVSGASYENSPTPDMNLHIINTKIDMETQASYIANIINEKIEEKHLVNDKGTLRPVNYGDFCILVRTNKYLNPYVKTLTKFGIPATSQGSDDLLSYYEVAVLLNSLKIIDNPLQDIPLLSVLMSPIGGFSEDDIANIKTTYNMGSLYLSLKKASSDNELIKKFLDNLEKLRKISIMVDVSELLDIIFVNSSFIAVIKAKKKGDTIIDKIHTLYNYAKNYDKTSYRGITSFVKFIEQIEDEKVVFKTDEKELGNNSVKIMTMHKSKGLEFPFCFISIEDKGFNVDEIKNNIVIDKKLGIGSIAKNIKENVRINSLPRTSINIKTVQESIAEEMRVLYVALTRAREKLYIVFPCNDIEKRVNELSAYIIPNKKTDPFAIDMLKSFTKWITLCALKHKNGNELRKLANIYETDFINYDTSSWDIKIIEDLTFLENQEVITQKENDVTLVNIDEVVKQFKSIYDKKILSTIPVKVSASNISHKDMEKTFNFKSKPTFMKGDEVTATQRGNAIHTFMQFVDFKSFIIDNQKEIDRLLLQGYLNETQCKILNTRKIEKCLSSITMKQLLNSSNIMREFRFTVKINASLVDETLKPPFSDEDVILQGAVDLAFEENGEIIIIDYKTDRVKTLEQLKDMYKKQLDLYKIAMEKCTGKTVKKCVLYSFSLNDEIEV